MSTNNLNNLNKFKVFHSLITNFFSDSLVELTKQLNNRLKKSTEDFNVEEVCALLDLKPLKNEVKHRKIKNKNVSPGIKKCKYIFKRGKNVGKPCGATCLVGKEYCKSCCKKKAVKKITDGSVTSPVRSLQREEIKKPELEVLDAIRKIFLMPKENFVVQIDNNNALLFATWDKAEKKYIPLTEKDREAGSKMGLSVYKEDPNKNPSENIDLVKQKLIEEQGQNDQFASRELSFSNNQSKISARVDREKISDEEDSDEEENRPVRSIRSRQGLRKPIRRGRPHLTAVQRKAN